MWQDTLEHFKDMFAWPPRKLVSEYRISIAVTTSVRIKVWEDSEGRFIGDCEYAVQGSKCATPYSSGHPQPTELDALRDAVSAFFMFLDTGATLHNRWNPSEEVITWE